ncbi:hypothetical protein [Novosphingobium sp. EMRT-2]|uniref:hypothetical protein n=1 Tax=Novosphingobium sp. EMRT-2 TaxID=2571749 RepID=UPI0010BCF54C|nr:hypothetical protein [Novosphingobium sp. EMRT-2]MCH2219924.1 hypothetical protein [Dechloromonas sp.]QCI92403.1 hypothetical protein FA702_01705 [Novosphingobium sp. EMRT-2]
MTGPASLNGSSHSSGPPRHCPFACRRADETLHEFLLRRHDEMGAELITLRALVVDQEFTLADERRAARRTIGLLVAGQTLVATLASTVCWFVAPGNPAQILLAVAAATALGGGLLVRYAPNIHRGLARVLYHMRSWRRA